MAALSFERFLELLRGRARQHRGPTAHAKIAREMNFALVLRAAQLLLPGEINRAVEWLKASEPSESEASAVCRLIACAGQPAELVALSGESRSPHTRKHAILSLGSLAALPGCARRIEIIAFLQLRFFEEEAPGTACLIAELLLSLDVNPDRERLRAVFRQSTDRLERLSGAKSLLRLGVEDPDVVATVTAPILAEDPLPYGREMKAPALERWRAILASVGALKDLRPLPGVGRRLRQLFEEVPSQQLRQLIMEAISVYPPEAIELIRQTLNSRRKRWQVAALEAAARLGPRARSLRERIERLSAPTPKLERAKKVALARITEEAI